MNLKNSFSGFSCLLYGFRTMLKEGYRMYTLLPVLINAVLMTAAIYLFMGAVGRGTNWVLSMFPDWMSFLRWIIIPFAFISMMLICAYLFVAVESIVICPFASFLAEKAEQDITGKVRQQPEIPAGKYPAWIAGIAWHSLKRTARSYCFYLPCALLCLIIFLIPAVGQVLFPVVWLLLSGWWLAMQNLDYVFDNNGISFAEMSRRMRKSPVPVISFGCLTAAIAAVPVANILVLPAAVIGATRLFLVDPKLNGSEALTGEAGTSAAVEPGTSVTEK
ncbi:MAG: sulfate transporter CysZ [Succinivibrionaceae bacterium]|jgi:CysZ protein|nr:sulfate transporter CysZ [Succinivibrionaceae bacterium]MCI6199738.1 sulfate transporter CysZ [Pseudomonadota bacterium]MDD6545504.1 sulfate transporter CysZ [Pseudomonadota bacterium]MDY3145349.1 sulfate transporter CysZ [Succinivibrionaceae bacterium]MDY6275754.1 sulfate transporter CysZ [Succinivibrionaceae bacterium]